MPWLPLYATPADLDMVIQWLNEDDEIAFVMPDGPERWIARKAISCIDRARYCLWHVPSGPLPLLGDGGAVIREVRGWLATRMGIPMPSRSPRRHVDDWIADPWKGWRGSIGANPTQPYFGSHPGIIWFNAAIQAEEQVVPMSGFEWIGNRYKPLGRGATRATEEWWRRLRRRVANAATRVPRGGPTSTMPLEIYALPGALEAFERGAKGAMNPDVY